VPGARGAACPAPAVPHYLSILSTRSDPMADFMKILQQAQEMQGKFTQLQDELKQQTVTAASGGGMVRVEATGQGTIRSIKIDPSLLKGSDVEMLEDLVLVAVTEVQRKAAELGQQEMSKLTGGLNLPFKLPF
jgi:nucleoid-associated protein EbfC